MFDLSIAIPTYQRLPLLQKNLSQLLNSVTDSGLSERVQICVSDNGSTDGTWEFLQQMQQTFPALKCFCQKENLRFARNFWTAGLMGDGQFIYFSGDDDDLPASALYLLLAQAERFADKFLIMNSSLPCASYSARHPAPDEVLLLSGLPEYLTKCGLFFGSFIGNLLFRRDYFQRYADYLTLVEQSAYPHFIPVTRAIREGKAAVINQPVSVPDDGSRSWRKWQRIYTAVDMARLVREEMAPFLSPAETRGIFAGLARSLPMACVYFWQNEWDRQRRPGKASFWCQSEPPRCNPYASCTIGNLWEIYVRSR